MNSFFLDYWVDNLKISEKWTLNYISLIVKNRLSFVNSKIFLIEGDNPVTIRLAPASFTALAPPLSSKRGELLKGL